MKGCKLVVGMMVVAAASVWAADKQPFEAKGMFVEGCSCGRPCACQLTGIEPGCQGVNALALTGGSYQGVDLTGVKIAFGLGAGKWVRLYVDAPKPEQREAATAFAKAYSAAFGKIEEVKAARVEISGQAGTYTLKVDGGKIMNLVTEPVLGGDGKTPLMYSNIHDSLHPTVKQGKTVTGKYQDGGHAFELKDSNAYFHETFESKGSL